MSLLNDAEISDNDKLRTVYEHIAQQIAGNVSDKGEGECAGKGRMLVTGGGAFNTFLIELISNQIPVELVIPSKEIVNFKEALIFAFMGVLRINGMNNCLSSVTGAKRDHCSGVFFSPERKIP